jgi:hypothetical protein
MTQYESEYGFFPQRAKPACTTTVTSWPMLKLTMLDGMLKPNGKKYIDWQGLGFGVDVSGNCLDAFEQPLQYLCPGTMNTTKFDLWSIGPDGKPGKAGVDDDGANGTDDFCESLTTVETNDDITNWKRGM